MKPVLTLIVFLISLTAFGQKVDWSTFDRAWEKYQTNPTHDNAVAVYDLLPNKAMGGDYPEGDLMTKIFSNTAQTDRAIQKGDVDALRIAFKLLAVSDGEYMEGLQIEIGN